MMVVVRLLLVLAVLLLLLLLLLLAVDFLRVKLHEQPLLLRGRRLRCEHAIHRVHTSTA